jgi:hypothetical protein
MNTFGKMRETFGRQKTLNLMIATGQDQSPRTSDL